MTSTGNREGQRSLQIVAINGSIEGERKGKIGEREYTYPVVRVKYQMLWRTVYPYEYYPPRYYYDPFFWGPYYYPIPYPYFYPYPYYYP